MEIKESKENDILIVTINGRLDSNTYEQLGEKMTAITAGNKIVIDFSELDYISSAGLRIILMNAKKMKKAGGQFRLCGMKDFIKEIFDIAGFSKILNIDPVLANSISQMK